MVVVQTEGEINSAKRAGEPTDIEVECFVAGVAHDLQSSLLVLTKNIELLRAAGPPLNPAQEDHLRRVERTLERMRRLLANVRNYTWANGRLELGQVELEQVVGRAVETLAPAVEEQEAQIVVGELPTVTGDREQLEQLFENLLSNAIKFGPKGGRTAVSASREEGAWRIAVEDEGPGIAPDNHARVFEPFRRLRETSHVAGSGLGLTICMRVARNHGGSLTVERSAAGGCTFVFTLPDLRDGGS